MIRHKHVDGKPTPRNAATRDHYEPRTYGGKTTYDNMVAACRLCNEMRGELDAIAFYNLVQKWFKQDPTLKDRWHVITHEEWVEFKMRCQDVHAKRLRGLGVKHVELAWRHWSFVTSYRRHSIRA